MRRVRLETVLRPFLESSKLHTIYCYTDKRESDMVIDDVREAQKDDALVRGF